MLIIICLIFVILFSLLGFFYAIIYNELQHYKTRIELSELSVDENLRKKFDTICDINIDIKKLDESKNYLKEYIELKDLKLTNFDTDRKLSEAMILIKELYDDHKDLKTADFKKKLNSIKETDELLCASKNFYNKNTSLLNDLIRKFPNNFVASRHGFKIKPFFDNKNMQDSVIDDFKL